MTFALLAQATNGFRFSDVHCPARLANSLMWPSICAGHSLGRFTKAGSSMMVMAISGAAVLPLLYGRIADIANEKKSHTGL